jgi:hypothetical protein
VVDGILVGHRILICDRDGKWTDGFLFTVPTVTFKVLFVFVILAHHRRRVVHVNVTVSPDLR